MLIDIITKVPLGNLSRNEPTKKDHAIMATDSIILLHVFKINDNDKKAK